MNTERKPSARITFNQCRTTKGDGNELEKMSFYTTLSWEPANVFVISHAYYTVIYADITEDYTKFKDSYHIGHTIEMRWAGDWL